MHPLPHNYSMTLNYNGNMEAVAQCAGQADFAVSAPAEFGGPASGWSPEGLLLNSVASCIALTFANIASMMKVEFSNLTIAASGVVDNMEGEKRMHFSSITLQPSLTLANPADEAKLAKIWENTEKFCLVSNSINTPVHIDAAMVQAA